MTRPGEVSAVDHLAALRTEGDRLVAAVRRADPDAAVPGLTWDVRTVATHTGAVHRWAADLVRRRLATNETGGSTAFRPEGLRDADLPAWLAEGVEVLVETLVDARPTWAATRSSTGSRRGRSGADARRTRPPCTGPTSRGRAAGP